MAVGAEIACSEISPRDTFYSTRRFVIAPSPFET